MLAGVLIDDYRMLAEVITNWVPNACWGIGNWVPNIFLGVHGSKR